LIPGVKTTREAGDITAHAGIEVVGIFTLADIRPRILEEACGMHYVDLARWYANSDYDRWHAQGIRMWSWRDPWWINAHGQFKSGVVFSITQGFVYGQMAETSVVRCGMDLIGTKGVVRMQHDFRTVRIEFHGISITDAKEGSYGGKKLDVMCERFARALDSGDASLLPTARDSVIASEVSQAMLDAASRDAAPCIGTPDEMAEILTHRKQHKGRRADDSSTRTDGDAD
jgi:myo-inositol 2-dehydrogenase/D-chiro-inositol 1-dehydrogenase